VEKPSQGTCHGQESRSKCAGKGGVRSLAGKSRQHCSSEHLAQLKGLPKAGLGRVWASKGLQAPASLLAAHNLVHSLSLAAPGKASTPKRLSAMASGNDGDPPRAHGRRGSNGRRLSQELNSGKKTLLCYAEEEAFSTLFFFFFLPGVFLWGFFIPPGRFAGMG